MHFFRMFDNAYGDLSLLSQLCNLRCQIGSTGAEFFRFFRGCAAKVIVEPGALGA